MPDRRVAGHIVIIKSASVHIEQLPPLVIVGPLNVHALQEEWTQIYRDLVYRKSLQSTYLGRIPDALAGREVGVHKIPRAGLYDFHPFNTVSGRKQNNNSR